MTALGLRWRLTIGLWGITACLLIGLVLFEYRSLEQFLIQSTAVRLRAQAKPIIDERLLNPELEYADLLAQAPGLVRNLTSRETGALIVDDQGQPIGQYTSQIGEPAPPLLEPSWYAPSLAGDLDVTYVLPNGAGQRQMLVLVPLPPRRPPEAVLVLNTPLETIDTILRAQMFLSIGGATITFLVAAALIGLFVRSSLAPLGKMAELAKRLAAGDLSQRLELRVGRDEVGLLAQALDEMATELERAFHAQHASEQRLRNFVLDASHELRTPMAVIGGYADMVRDAERNHRPVAPLATAMRREITRMARLVQDLLTLARTDLAMTFERQRVDLADLLHEIYEETSLMGPDHVVSLDVTGPLLVWGDIDRLKQAILNLTSNALRHTPAGTSVQIGASNQDGQAVVTVRDDGPGIPNELLPRVFERYARQNAAQGRRGLGIGLAIVKAIVEAHGGTVTAESQVGCGATFTIRLALAEPQ
ncbi:MAG: HAMP domain-containing sensor histidine kinase [Chloroflexi bacterium OHK40]